MSNENETKKHRDYHLYRTENTRSVKIMADKQKMPGRMGKNRNAQTKIL